MTGVAPQVGAADRRRAMLRRAPARLHLDASVLEEATLAILDAFGMARSSATTTPERDLAGTA